MQDELGHFFGVREGLLLVTIRQIEDDVAADLASVEPAAVLAERVLDRPALGIQHFFSRHDLHTDFHHPTPTY